MAAEDRRMRALRVCSKLREKCTITYLLFLIPILYFLHSLIIVQSHDWDLDSFLYLGSRLDSGKLIYFTDYEVKLPLLQYVFWLPYLLGGIGAWRLITFALSLLLALISSHLIVRSLTENSQDLNLLSRTITPLSASVFLTFLYSLPGSSSAHIEIFAAIFIYLAIALWHRALANKSHAYVYILLSGFATAIAVSIRPNYLFTIPAFVLFSIVATIKSVNLEKCTHAIKQVTLFILAASLMTIIQFVPYFLYKNGPSVLLSAMLALFQFSWRSSFIESLTLSDSGRSAASRIARAFESQFYTKDTVAFYLFMYLSMGIMLLLVHYKEHRSDLTASIFLSGTLLCLASVIGIEYSCINTTYHDHYSLMYAPYASVIFTYLCILISGKKSHLIKSGAILFHKYHLILAILIGWYFSVMGTQLWNMRDAILTPKLSLSINDRNIDTALMNFLKQIISKGMSFYVPDNANYHRLLNQDRIGDGHPAMLRNVLAGRRIGPIGSIFLYSDTVYKAPCLALWESQKDIIIIGVVDQLLYRQVLQCLLPAASGYKEISSGHGVDRIFARRESLGSVPR